MILTPFRIMCDVRAGKGANACHGYVEVFARDARHAETLYIEQGGKVETVDTGGGYKQKHTCPSCK